MRVRESHHIECHAGRATMMDRRGVCVCVSCASCVGPRTDLNVCNPINLHARHAHACVLLYRALYTLFQSKPINHIRCGPDNSNITIILLYQQVAICAHTHTSYTFLWVIIGQQLSAFTHHICMYIGSDLFIRLFVMATGLATSSCASCAHVAYMLMPRRVTNDLRHQQQCGCHRSPARPLFCLCWLRVSKHIINDPRAECPLASSTNAHSIFAAQIHIK